ncbi:VOC family protein [Haloferax sp. DFSO60]|uniref:VOC family protein n=1 Tax=Haloferax sp. DFSO60 TaxID=3388652 RepID=UPI00397DD316
MTDSPPPDFSGRPDGPGAVRALGEFALRVEAFETMYTFYRDVVGLGEQIGEYDTMAFFGLGESAAGHEAVFVLFDRTETDGYEGIDQAHTTIDPEGNRVEFVCFDPDGSDKNEQYA